MNLVRYDVFLKPEENELLLKQGVMPEQVVRRHIEESKQKDTKHEVPHVDIKHTIAKTAAPKKPRKYVEMMNLLTIPVLDKIIALSPNNPKRKPRDKEDRLDFLARNPPTITQIEFTEEILMGMKKDDMRRISDYYGIKSKSSYTKTEIAHDILEYEKNQYT